jgi:peptidoglycan-associated lipoprotein
MGKYLVIVLILLLSGCKNAPWRDWNWPGSRAAAERARAEEMRRQEEARRQEAARQRLQEEVRRQAETRRQEEAQRQAEARRQEEMRRQEEARRQEELRQQEARRQEELRQERARREEQVRRQEEERRLAEEARRREELRRAEEARLIEERRRQLLEDGEDPSLVGMVTEEQLRKFNPLLVERSVFYEFDRYDIKPNYATIIAAHAKFLIQHPTVKIFLEGNADDRGSPDYNVALGQRRSNGVHGALLALGVPAKQIESVSYGAERPLAFGQSEESWAKNRRTDFAYPMR